MSALLKNGVNYTLGNSYISAFESSVLGWVVPPSMTDTNEVNGDKFIQRINRIDMSDFAWIDLYNFSVPVMNYKSLNPKAVTIPNTQKSNIFIDLYEAVAWSDVIGRVKDKIIAVSDDTILIHDSRYTSSSDIASFKANLKGHYFYYEMANPIEHSISGNEIVNQINESLTDYGLDNKYNGVFKRAYINTSDGTFVDSTRDVVTDYIPCSNNSVIKLKMGIPHYTQVAFYNGSSFIKIVSLNVVSQYEMVAPSNATRFVVSYIFSGNTRNETEIKDLTVYVDNAIDTLKADLATNKLFVGSLNCTVAGQLALPNGMTISSWCTGMVVMARNSSTGAILTTRWHPSGYFEVVSGTVSVGQAVNCQFVYR